MFEKSRKETTRSSKMRTVANMLRNASLGTNNATINTVSPLVKKMEQIFQDIGTQILQDFGRDFDTEEQDDFTSNRKLRKFNAAQDGDKPIMSEYLDDSLDWLSDFVEEFEDRLYLLGYGIRIPESKIRIPESMINESTTFNTILKYLKSIGFT